MKLLVTGAWQDAARHIPELTALGHEIFFLQQEKDTLPLAAEEIEGVICNGLFLFHDIHEFTAMQFIQLTSAGTDRVPEAYIREKKIRLYPARGVYSTPMAEHALAGVLALYRQMGTFREQQKQHVWNKLRNLKEIAGKEVLIFGCGSVGQACAKRFAAFDAHVTGADIMPGERSWFDRVYGMEEAEAHFKKADIVISCLPLAESTWHFFDREMLGQMKDGSIFVNLSRGGVADTDALTDALAAGKPAGAVLDVFEEEPLPADSPLWEMENVILTPHNSFVGEGNGERLWKCIQENIGRVKEGS